MSDINEKNIRSLSKLCRLEITDEEVHKLSHDLKRVVDHIEQLQEVDVSDLAPYSHMDAQGYGSLRDDEVSRVLDRDVFLANSPDQVGGMIRVPPVMKDV